MGIFVYQVSFRIQKWTNQHKDMMSERGIDVKGDAGFVTYFYMLTTVGEVICLQDYCARLCQNPQVQCVLMLDSSSQDKVSDSMLNPSAQGKEGWRELGLSEASCYSRVHLFVHFDVQELLAFLTHERQKNSGNTLQLPHHFTRIGIAGLDSWSYATPEQMILDMRSAKQKDHHRRNVPEYSLSSSLSIIKQRPEIIYKEPQYDATSAPPMMIHLKAQKVLLQVFGH